MEFLTPFFAAAGIAAGVVPIVLHMLRRAPTERTPFSVVKFLRPDRPKMTRRSRVENWPLMLLRIAALILIGFAFARPFLRESVPAEESGRTGVITAVLIDASASMRRDGIRTAVADTLEELSDELADSDFVTLAQFSDSFRPVVSPDEWAAAEPPERRVLLNQVVEEYEPDWLATRTDSALTAAADLISRQIPGAPSAADRRIILITDFQRGSRLSGLTPADWPEGVRIELKITEPAEPGNAGISLSRFDRNERPLFRIVNAGDSARTDFLLQPFDAEGAPIGDAVPVTVDPGRRRTVGLGEPDPDLVSRIRGVELAGDPHPFDNIIDLPEHELRNVQIAVAADDDANNPDTMFYYLQRVLDGVPDARVTVTEIQPEDGPPLPVPPTARLAIVTEEVQPSLTVSLQDLLSADGVIMIAAPSASVIESLLPLLPTGTTAEEADVEDYAMFSRIDFNHPLFADFADGRFSDFSSVRVWKHRRVRLPPVNDEEEGRTEVLVEFDSGDPAVIEYRPAGGGRVLLLTFGWQPGDSQWALSNRFPPFISSVLRLTDRQRTDSRRLETGETIDPVADSAGQSWVLVTPIGDELQPEETTAGSTESGSAVATGEPDAEQNSIRLTEPGRYVLRSADEPDSVLCTYFVTVPPSESQTDTLPAGQLQAIGIGTDAQTAGESPNTGSDPESSDADRLSSVELEARQQWWRWFLLAGLGCLALESVWSALIDRRLSESPV